MNLDERERVVLARVVETFCPEAPARAVADRIAGDLLAIDRPRLVADLGLFLRLIEQPLLNLALAGRPKRFSSMSARQRERYLLRWGDSPFGRRRAAFQAVKRLALFAAYARSDGENPLWEGTGYARPELVPPAAPALTPREVSDGEELVADACVIGSGAGGGVAAAELAAAGMKVVVLEQGPLATDPPSTGVRTTARHASSGTGRCSPPKTSR